MTEPASPAAAEIDDGVVAAARTEREAFGRLFDRFYIDVWRYARRRLLVDAAAEDAASETFLHVARSLRGFRETTVEGFRRWLFRIATNEINARLRQTRRRRELLEAAARCGAVKAQGWTEAETGCGVEWGQLHGALLELPEREQSMISLRYFAGLDHAGVAAVLQMTEGAVRTALSRALQRLRDRLRTPADAPRSASRRSAGRENRDG